MSDPVLSPLLIEAMVPVQRQKLLFLKERQGNTMEGTKVNEKQHHGLQSVPTSP